MKKTLLLGIFAVLVMTAAPASAQFEITPFVGFQFDGELAAIGDETTRHDLDQGTTWGLMLDVKITSADYVELYYSSQGTDLDGVTGPSSEVTVDHLQIGAIREYRSRQPVSPYIGFSLGATRFDVTGGSDTRFSGGLTLGAKMIVSDHLGFRFDARVFGISTGSGEIGCSADTCIGYPDTSLIWQYTVNAGVILHFGNK
jgi:hypothetical protein